MNVNLTRSAVLCALFAVACGDDDERPVYTSGVAEETRDESASSLDEQTREQLCESRDQYLEANVGLDIIARAVCLVPAIIIGGSPERCEEIVDECMANRGGLDVNISLGRTNDCARTLASCDASVATLEGCINVNTDWVYDVLDTLSCGRVRDADQRDRATTLRGANACADIGTTCEGFTETIR